MCRVVLVDDDESFSETMREILEEEGHEVLTHGAVNFVQRYEEMKPDVLVVDVWFGDDQNGLKLSQALANHKELYNVPLILISSDERVARFAQEVRAYSYLQKPFSIPEILAKIDQVTHPS